MPTLAFLLPSEVVYLEPLPSFFLMSLHLNLLWSKAPVPVPPGSVLFRPLTCNARVVDYVFLIVRIYNLSLTTILRLQFMCFYQINLDQITTLITEIVCPIVVGWQYSLHLFVLSLTTPTCQNFKKLTTFYLYCWSFSNTHCQCPRRPLSLFGIHLVVNQDLCFFNFWTTLKSLDPIYWCTIAFLYFSPIIFSFSKLGEKCSMYRL